MVAKFIEVEQIWANEQTRYWFDVESDGISDGGQFCIVESGPDVDYLDSDGVPLNDGPDRRLAMRECVVTDEIRASASGL